MVGGTGDCRVRGRGAGGHNLRSFGLVRGEGYEVGLRMQCNYES